MKDNTLCKLINAAIEDEAHAGKEYMEILEAIPDDEKYKKCTESIIKIMEDEINHAITLARLGKELGCIEPKLSKEDEDVIELSKYIRKIKLK